MVNTSCWETSSPDPNDERVARLVKNSFDVEETVELTVRHWKHFDWLAEQGVDMDLWTRTADLERHRAEYGMSFQGELQASLFFDERRRFLAGLPCPLFITPEGHIGEIIPEEIPERLASDHEWFERKLVGKLGVEVPVSMQGRHWRFFDWITDNIGDLSEMVIEIDFFASGKDSTLSKELMKTLRGNERRQLLNGNNWNGYKIPMFINPNGYLNLDIRTAGKEGIPRQVVDSKGEMVTLPLPKKYWKYFDWLAKQGQDMEKWVKDADVSRNRENGRVLTLRSEIILGLQEDERRRFKSDEPCPLYLNPNGYDL